MTVSNDLSAWNWDPSYKGVQINGTTYKPPTTTYTTDDKGKIVATSTPDKGMEALTGLNTTGKSATEFDGETFLKLLVTQLKYQDPSKPMDSSQIMQQSATLSMVEQINNMVKSNDKIQSTYTTMLAEQRIASSVGLVGRSVEYTPDPNDPTKTASGVVDSVKFDGTGPILSVGGKDVPYQNVTQVRTLGGAGSGGASGTAGSSGSASSGSASSGSDGSATSGSSAGGTTGATGSTTGGTGSTTGSTTGTAGTSGSSTGATAPSGSTSGTTPGTTTGTTGSTSTSSTTSGSTGGTSGSTTA